MKSLIVLFCALILVVNFVENSARNYDEHKDHKENRHHKDHLQQKSQHHLHHGSQEKYHHHLRHHHAYKSRNSNGTLSNIDAELLAIVKWFNNTQEAKLIYQLIPPRVLGTFINNTNNTFNNVTNWINSTIFNDTNTNLNTTIFNGIDLNSLYDPAEDWAIFSYFARLFAKLFATGIENLFKVFPFFRKIFTDFAEIPEIFADNFKKVLGGNNSFPSFNNVSKVVSNLTHYTSVPVNISKDVEQLFEGGIQQLTNLTRKQKV